MIATMYISIGGIIIGVVSDCVSSRAMSCMMMLLLAVPSVSEPLHLVSVKVRGEHVSSEHVSCEHVSCEHVSCEHVDQW